MHFDEEMGFQFLGPRSTVLSPSDPRPPTVQHWPAAVAAWWSSRACMQGPAGELCDVVFFPIILMVHHTWQAPLSLQLFVWSFLASTLCSSTVTVCQSRSLKLKTSLIGSGGASRIPSYVRNATVPQSIRPVVPAEVIHLDD